MATQALKGYEYFLENYVDTSFDDINEYLKNSGYKPLKQVTYEHFQELLKYGYTSYVSSAQFVDSLNGYKFFLKKRGNTSIDDVNLYLKSINGRIIHPRTYRHYEKLLKRGFSSYIPINQFDVSRTLGKLQFASDRRRYLREITQQNAKVSKEGELWTPVKIRDKSLVGFGIETTKQMPFEPFNPLFIRIDEYRDIPVIMVWKHCENGLLRFGVRSLEFIETYRISEPGILVSKPTGLLIVKKLSGKYLSWDELYRVLEKINELIEGSSELLREIAKNAGLKEFNIIQSDLSSISFDSPFDIAINIDIDVVKILIVIFSWCYLDKVRKERYRKTAGGINNNNNKLDNNNQLLDSELRRNAINPKKESEEPDVPQEVSDSLQEELKDIYKIKQLPPGLLAPGSFESGILKNQVFPAAVELIAGDDPEIEVKVTKSHSDEKDEK